jgi:hypothetical protein
MNLLAHLSSSHESVKKLAEPWKDIISLEVWGASYDVARSLLDVTGLGSN